MKERPELWIFADWDETITKHDTLSLIAPPDSSDPKGPPPFSYFSKYYMGLMTEHDKAFGPRDTLERQLEYLVSLTPIEKASVMEVEEKGLFKGVKEEDIRRRAQRVEFREGWKEFTYATTDKEHIRFRAILSVNWSGVFIKSALQRIHDEAFLNQFEIRANVNTVQGVS